VAPQDEPLEDADRQSAGDAADEGHEKQKGVAEQRGARDLDDEVRQNDGQGGRQHPLDREKNPDLHIDVPCQASWDGSRPSADAAKSPNSSGPIGVILTEPQNSAGPMAKQTRTDSSQAEQILKTIAFDEKSICCPREATHRDRPASLSRRRRTRRPVSVRVGDDPPYRRRTSDTITCQGILRDSVDRSSTSLRFRARFVVRVRFAAFRWKRSGSLARGRSLLKVSAILPVTSNSANFLRCALLLSGIGVQPS
jgi:hypothetical protein